MTPEMYTGHSFEAQVAIHKRYCDSAIEGYRSSTKLYGVSYMAAARKDEAEAKKQAEYILTVIRTGCFTGLKARTTVERLKTAQRYERLFMLRHQKIEAAKPESKGVVLP